MSISTSVRALISSVCLLTLGTAPLAQPQVAGQRGQPPNAANAIDPRSPQSVAVVYKIAPSGAISAVAGTGTAGFSGDGGPAIQAQLRNPTAVALDATGNL